MELSKDGVMATKYGFPLLNCLIFPLMFFLDVAAKGKVEMSNFKCTAKWLYDTLTCQDVDRVDRYHVSKIPMKAPVCQQ